MSEMPASWTLTAVTITSVSVHGITKVFVDEKENWFAPT
jgi:hypothetical protein